MAADRRRWVFAWGALLIATLALGGCSTSIADLQAIGTPAGAPERPKEAGAYLPVHDLPPNREEAIISPEEQRKIQGELTAAREHQATAMGTKDVKPKPETKSDAKAASSKSKSQAKAEAKADQ